MDTRRKYLWTLAFAVSVIGARPAGAQETAPTGWRKFGESRAPEPQAAAAQLTLPAGSWITIRVDQPLSSDHNQPGDAFAGTLVQPLVVNGIVIARRGQTVGGRVAEAQKAGRAKGTSRLGLEVTEISLVDGLQMPVRTQLVERRGTTSVGRDAAAVGTATGVGAAIGAAADGGFGAGMGAIAGAAASTIGVLVTRGNPTVVYPESVLTFRLEEPVTISTERAVEAFQPVGQADYDRPAYRPGLPPAPYPPPYYAGYYPPFFYGPGLFFYSGPRFFYGRGLYRRW